MPKIYRVFQNDTQVRFNFFVTKKEAEAFKKEYLKDNTDKDFTCDIEEMEVKLTRKGIVDELNWLITTTCFNEG